VSKIFKDENMLLLYKYNRKGILMENNEETARNIAVSLRINKKDKDFLRDMSKLRSEKKFMPGKEVYNLMQIGIDTVKKQMKKEIGDREVSCFIKQDVLDDAIKIAAALDEFNMSLQIKIKDKNDKKKHENSNKKN